MENPVGRPKNQRNAPDHNAGRPSKADQEKKAAENIAMINPKKGKSEDLDIENEIFKNEGLVTKPNQKKKKEKGVVIPAARSIISLLGSINSNLRKQAENNPESITSQVEDSGFEKGNTGSDIPWNDAVNETNMKAA